MWYGFIFAVLAILYVFPHSCKVIAILDQRHNPDLDRVEFFTSWVDGDYSWEPKESFIDDDGVYTVRF